ncbi:hypothetical protein FI667_g1494, partial [Globisporangium splendens]
MEDSANDCACALQLSSSSIIIRSDGHAALVACAPTVHTLSTLLELKVLEYEQPARSIVNRHMQDSGMTQDIRSVAYVMVEMLTGMRVRGHLLESEHILDLTSANSMESRFLANLLQAKSLSDVMKEPYLLDRDHHSPDNTPLSGNNHVELAHTRAIAILMDQELTRCREQRRHHLSEIRAWLAQFERRHERKPTAAERPKSWSNLQRRCRVLTDRIKELEARLSEARKGFYKKSDFQNDEEELEHATRLDDPASASGSLSPDASNGRISKLEIPLALNVTIRQVDGEMIDVHKRSPAQNAFLKRLAHGSAGGDTDQSVQEHSEIIHSNRVPQHHLPSDRLNGQELMHQRKEVARVINDLAGF